MTKSKPLNIFPMNNDFHIPIPATNTWCYKSLMIVALNNWMRATADDQLCNLFSISEQNRSFTPENGSEIADYLIHIRCLFWYSLHHNGHVNIYIYINTELLDGNQSHQEETHRPTHRFWRLFLDLLSIGWRGCASAMGVIKLPPSFSSPKIMCQPIDMI